MALRQSDGSTVPIRHARTRRSVLWGVVNVQADGLNVRVAPNGPPVMALVNGTPLYPMDKRGDWLLVAPACDLTPTWAWSWTAGVPLNRCWVYF